MSTDHPDRDISAEEQQITDLSKSASPQRPRRLAMLIVIAGVILIADILTKVWAVAAITPGQPIEIIGDVVTFTLIRNPGAAFSMATSMTWILTLVAIGVVIGVIKIGRTLRSPWWALGLGLVLGGALGNLMDRLFRAPGFMTGHVVDFMSIGWWPVFNIADSAIVCGAILLVVLTLFGYEPNGERLRSSDTAGSDTAGSDTAGSDTADSDTSENQGENK